MIFSARAIFSADLYRFKNLEKDSLRAYEESVSWNLKKRWYRILLAKLMKRA